MNVTRDDELMAKAADLATEIAPSRDLWPGVEAAIEASPAGGQAPRNSWFSPYLAQAAAVLLLVAGSSGITWYVMKDEAAPVVVTPDLLFREASFASYDLGPGFQDARAKLSSQLDEELARLSPEARTEVEENLEAIRAAISEINAALQSEPDNVLLQELLLKTYQEELTVMRHVGGLTQDVMSRNNGGRTDI